MKPTPRKTLATCLVLGTAALTSPVQAAIAQCPRPLFWRTGMPINEAYERMIQFAGKKVADAPSIFKGHVINAEFIGFEDDFHTFIVTFKVTKWMKGSGQPHARIVYVSECDGCPTSLEMKDEIVREHEDAIYVSEPSTSAFMQRDVPIKNIDGVFLPCAHYGRRIGVVSQQGLPPRVEHKRFLLDLVMRREIEKLSPMRHPIP
jgi:hypothetical protein